MGVDIVEKNFKTINEQVEILKNKGLIIEDENVVKDTLLRENYFFLMGYRHAFLISQKERKFIPGTTFNEIYSLFTFDRNFRNIIFKNVLVIENQLKSVISYQLSKKYGYREKDYLNPKNFTQDHDILYLVLLFRFYVQIRYLHEHINFDSWIILLVYLIRHLV